MRIATVGGKEVDVRGGVIAGLVALVPVLTLLTTVTTDWYKERSKNAISAGEAETGRQAAEMQRLKLALSLEDPEARRQSIRLLIQARLLRDVDKKLEQIPATEVPRWPPDKTLDAPAAPAGLAPTQKPQLPGKSER
ncbi:hypothetical protein BH18ACI5_BH18ACI5_14570 [soil metagenome]